MIDAAAPAGDPDLTEPDLSEPVTAVADNFVALMRSFQRAKMRFMAATEHDIEWSAQILLRHLAVEGPMRASAIAESMHSDPSTVSRQVAALVRDGLVERRADPEDGRASILVPTAKADAVLADHAHQRIEHFAGILSDWNERDLRRFATLLHRFTDDFETASTKITERAAARRRSTEGKN